MGWLVGLPLGLLRLLLVALRFALPILIIVAIVLVARHLRKKAARYRDEDREQEPKFHGPVYTVDYREVDDEDDKKEP